jgi:hypothetical protein
MPKAHGVAFLLLSLHFETEAAQMTVQRELPSLPLKGARAREIAPRDAKWWARVGDKLYHAPTQELSALQLSTNVSDYYYARGPKSALPEELITHRVGGDGSWHLFHLPAGVPESTRGAVHRTPPRGRRASFSSLMQLRSGIVLSQSFPGYASMDSYKNPLSAEAADLEKKAADTIEGEGVLADLKKLTNLSSRSFEDKSATEAATSLLNASFVDLGYKTCFQYFGSSFSSVSSYLANVLAYLPGASGSSGSVTVGAHYDSRPFSGPAPGAEDNGSGVAALLAIARAFALAKVKPEKTVYFVGFAGEEAGMLGSAAFASALKAGGGSIPAECLVQQSSSTESGAKGAKSGSSFLQHSLGLSKLMKGSSDSEHQAIIMDEVGWLSPKMSKPTLNLESYDWSQDLLQHLAAASTTHNGDNLSIVHSSSPFGSDHMSFLNERMPAVLLINGDDEAYPDYHQSGDTIDKVNTNYIAQIAKAALGGTMRVAGVSAH